jgi:effector-binding domain-containing protein
LGFTLEQTAKILASCGDDGDMTPFLEERLSQVHREISHQRQIAEEIQIILEGERKEAMSEQFDVVEKELEPQLICGIRFTGTYDAIGKRFSTLYKHAARYAAGKPLGLYYDQEYKEDDADIEAAVPVKKRVDLPGISCRELPGGQFVSTVHPGPYDQIGDSLSKLMEYCQKKNLAFTGPHREVYLKGPGMILPRNPKNYLTEVLLPVESDRG